MEEDGKTPIEIKFCKNVKELKIPQDLEDANNSEEDVIEFILEVQ